MAEHRRWQRFVPSPEFHLSPGERLAIHAMAKQRAAKVLRGRVPDKSWAKGPVVMKNSIGIAGEVCWARYLCVPWYQNPDPLGGDHHRLGDLQDRWGNWIEVKTSRNPRSVMIDSSTGQAWGYLAAAWWNGKKKIMRLTGVLPYMLAIALSKEKTRKGTTGKERRVLELEASRLHRSDSLFANHSRTYHPTDGKGLHCPWCVVGTWDCTEERCSIQKYERAEEIHNPNHKEK